MPHTGHLAGHMSTGKRVSRWGTVYIERALYARAELNSRTESQTDGTLSCVRIRRLLAPIM